MKLLILALLALPLFAVCTPTTGYTYCRPLTVDAVGSTLTDFPVLFAGNAFAKTVANGGRLESSSGFDLVFTSDEAGTTALACELVSGTYVATTGAGEWWFKTSLSTSTTVVYISYGNAGIGASQCTSTSTWNSAYKGVWHLPDGTTLTALDSTSNAVNGTLVNTPTAGTGKIDGAGSFASASTQYITLSNSINPTAVTYSLWVNATSFPAVYNAAISRFGDAGNYTQILIKSNGKLACYVFASAIVSYDGTGTATLSTSTWYHLTMVYDSSVGLIGYVNGSSDGTGSANGALVTTAANLRIASDSGTAGREWNGLLDEVRISDVVRSADWIAAEYSNQNDPGNFYAVGTEVGSSPAIKRRVIVL